jgi:hypothetical protein
MADDTSLPKFQGEAFSLPLDNGNKATLLFRTLPITEADYERVLKYLDLTREVFCNGARVGAEEEAGSPNRVHIATDVELSQATSLARAREQARWRNQTVEDQVKKMPGE